MILTTILGIIGLITLGYIVYLILGYQKHKNERIRKYKEKVLQYIELHRPYISKESQNIVIFKGIYEDGADVVKCEVGLTTETLHLTKEEVDRFIGIIKDGNYELRKEFSKDKYKTKINKSTMICD